FWPPNLIRLFSWRSVSKRIRRAVRNPRGALDSSWRRDGFDLSMRMSQWQHSRIGRRRSYGMSLLELVIAVSILLVLSSAALPVFRSTVVRHKEFELRRDLRQMRDAIDRYKNYSDRGMILGEAGSEVY